MGHRMRLDLRLFALIRFFSHNRGNEQSTKWTPVRIATEEA